MVEGAVIQIYCTVEDNTTITFTWTLNGSSLLNDPPHIRATGIPAPEIDFDFGNITARVDVRESSLPVEETRNQDGETVNQITRTTMINRTMDSDSGVYMCVVNNEYGMDQESFQLIIKGTL